MQDEGESFREIAVLLEELSGRAFERVGPDEGKRHRVSLPEVPT